MSGRESEVERDIGHVLAWVSEAKAAPGLEGRVLQRIAEVRGQRREVRWRRDALWAAACVVAAVVWVSFERTAPDRRSSVGVVRTASRVANPARGRGAGEADAVAEVAAPPAAKGLALAAHRADRQEVISDAERALEEMRAPSTPEVPRPLTGEEQMLVRVAQGRGAQALAKVDVEDAGSGEPTLPKPRNEGELVSVVRDGFFAGMRARTEGSSNEE